MRTKDIKPIKKVHLDNFHIAGSPLDGQQRLTTLFLLHWFAAKKEHIQESEYSFLSGFSYENRPASRDFCHKLLPFEPSFSVSLSSEIIDQNWFPLDWKHDPTIDSMLTMLDAIQTKFFGVENCKEDGWMFSFIGAGEDIIHIATTISITNTVLWEQTSKGTADVFANENDAQSRYYDKMAAPCCASASVADRKKMRKQFSEEYYDKDKK